MGYIVQLPKLLTLSEGAGSGAADAAAAAAVSAAASVAAAAAGAHRLTEGLVQHLVVSRPRLTKQQAINLLCALDAILLLVGDDNRVLFFPGCGGGAVEVGHIVSQRSWCSIWGCPVLAY